MTLEGWTIVRPATHQPAPYLVQHWWLGVDHKILSPLVLQCDSLADARRLVGEGATSWPPAKDDPPEILEHWAREGRKTTASA